MDSHSSPEPFQYRDLVELDDPPAPKGCSQLRTLLNGGGHEFWGNIDWMGDSPMYVYAIDQGCAVVGEARASRRALSNMHTIIVVPQHRIARTSTEHLCGCLPMLEETDRCSIAHIVSRERAEGSRWSLAFVIPDTVCPGDAGSDAFRTFQLALVRALIEWSEARDLRGPSMAFHADPEEAAEAYLMNRIPAGQLLAYQRHLSQCAFCSQVVDETEVFIQGMRDAGHFLTE